MVECIIRINRANYVCNGGLTPDYFSAKTFSIAEATQWLTERFSKIPELWKKHSLKDTDIEIMFVE